MQNDDELPLKDERRPVRIKGTGWMRCCFACGDMFIQTQQEILCHSCYEIARIESDELVRKAAADALRSAMKEK